MTICTPDYYNAFHCIAGDCPETCCAAGWEIDLDEDSMERYQSTEGEFGEKLCRFIRKDEDFFFFPMEHGACPFLTGKKLCSIYENLGEDAMPVTCQEFPRYFSDCGAYEQRDLSLACPEVARIFYEGPLSFGIRTFEVEDEDGEMFSEDDDYDSLVSRKCSRINVELVKRCGKELDNICSENGSRYVEFTAAERVASESDC